MDSDNFPVVFLCTVCTNERIIEMSLPDILDLVEHQFRQMECNRCNADTSWVAVAPDRRRLPRRAARRIPVEMPIQVQADPEFMEMTEMTRTVDVSRGGVRFFSRHNYGEGSEVRVRVPYDEEFEPMQVRAKVVWVKPVERGFHIGIEFLK